MKKKKNYSIVFEHLESSYMLNTTLKNIFFSSIFHKTNRGGGSEIRGYAPYIFYAFPKDAANPDNWVSGIPDHEEENKVWVLKEFVFYVQIKAAKTGSFCQLIG